MPADTNALAAIEFAKSMDIDRLLLQIATTIGRDGTRLGGLVQVTTGGLGMQATAVEVLDLATGDRFQIWEPRGQWAKGCRLDESGLAAAEAAVLRSIDAGIDLLLLNRFGRAESKGRGLINCFCRALEQGVPILTAVREPFDAAWAEFHGGLATLLPPEVDIALEWARNATGNRYKPKINPSLAATTHPLGLGQEIQLLRG